MKISLDRTALRMLIESDPNFELQLKTAVISEVTRRFFEKDSDRVIRAADPALFDQALKALQRDEDMVGQINHALRNRLLERSTSFFAIQKLSPDLAKVLNDATAAIRQKAVDDATVGISDAINAAVTNKVAEIMGSDEVNDRIEKRTNRLVNEYVEKKVGELFQARMADVRAAFEKATVF